MGEKQRQADLAHHRANVAWLTGPSPLWADGTPVGPSWVARLLVQNRQAIKQIEEWGMSTGCASLEAS